MITAMLTPFDGDGNVNLHEVKRIANFLVDKQRNDGVVVSGTTGESPTLSFDEKMAILDATLEAIGGRASVLFGAGTYDTAESIHLTHEAERRGAHGIMLVNPYYSRPGQEGLYAHFSTIALETSLPVLLYNIQPRSSINLETPTLLRLAQIPNIVGVKEASGNVPQISDVCGSVPDGFRVYSGDDGLTLPILAMGGHGIVSVAGHVVGDEIKTMLDDFFAGNLDRARRMHHRLATVFKALFSAPSPTPVKYALSREGFDCESVRLPLVALDEDQKSVVDRAMANLRAAV
ncbi:MAG TPA: 4-hydroxy-tetrahydrodipicolinate synthase [Fimbriimonadaceae bacterium]|nr:4-hydroxy-tetrahydrodipicolinate synthase [Fimbriimonadaceae bacterium]